MTVAGIQGDWRECAPRVHRAISGTFWYSLVRGCRMGLQALPTTLCPQPIATQKPKILDRLAVLAESEHDPSLGNPTVASR